MTSWAIRNTYSFITIVVVAATEVVYSRIKWEIAKYPQAYTAEIFLSKSWKPNNFVQFEISINVLVRPTSFR